MANTLAFIPPSLSASLSQKPVTDIYVAAHHPNLAAASKPGETASGAKQTNHWVLYLVTSPRTSVRFDLSPTGTGPAVLIIRNLPYMVSDQVVKAYTLSAKQGTSVQTVLDAIQESGYDRYNFAASGQGCRYWVYCVLNLLKSKELIDSAIDDALAGLQQVWGAGGVLAPAADQSGIVEGTFR